MKKNYSTPEFMLVTLDSKDIVCSSDPDFPTAGFGGTTTGDVTLKSKQRDNIWEDE